jgi:hypothetical protein
LTVHPQVVSPDEALPAGPDDWVPVVISELEGLVYPTMAITKVGRLWGTEMGAEALDVTWYERRDVSMIQKSPSADYKSRTHKPIALAKWRKPPSDKTQGELRPDIIIYIPPIMRTEDLREE